MNVQIIEQQGEPEYAVLDFKEFQAMREALDDALDLSGALAFKTRVLLGEEETYPSDLIERLMINENNPIMEYRKYRGMTQAALAEAIGVQQAAIAQFETGKREPLARQLQKLAEVLKVDMEMLLPLA